MSLVDVIASFKTGDYTVTRTPKGATTLGRYTAGSPSTFSIAASIQPVAGRELQALPEAQHGEEVRVIYTTTELKTRDPGFEPDTIEIDSEDWTIFRFERWQAFGAANDAQHFRAFASRKVIP